MAQNEQHRSNQAEQQLKIWSKDIRVNSRDILHSGVSDEYFIRELAAKIVREIPVEDLLKVFDLKKFPYNAVCIMRDEFKRFARQNDCETDDRFIFVDDVPTKIRTSEEIWRQTEGGMCSYYRLSLKV